MQNLMLVKEQNVAMHHVLAKDSVRISRRIGEGSTQSSSTDAHFLGGKIGFKFQFLYKISNIFDILPQIF